MPLNHKSGMQFQKIFSTILEISIAVNNTNQLIA